MIFGTPGFRRQRPSAHDQNLDLQLEGLRKAGYDRISQEKVYSAKERRELRELLELTRAGDTILGIG
ncbi:recombinase family protein [Dyadobacter arcticus]|uniref:recombinase family protein n=1 Tax=Dyadobacter arcticus TaxID=1078754 RepID=UPI0035B5EB56